MSIRQFKIDILDLLREGEDIEKREMLEFVEELLKNNTKQGLYDFLNRLVYEEVFHFEDEEVEKLLDRLQKEK